MIENYLSTLDSGSWVLDIRCSLHICNNLQKLKKMEQELLH
jgi:hypothetical protein